MIDDLPIVDAHQHFWDAGAGRYPWLSTDPLPVFRYGDYAALPRRYLPDDFRRDAAGHRVVATVHMEAEREIADEVGETRWLAGLRKEHGLPTVAVGHARFEAPDVGEVLAGHAAFDFARGIRQKPAAAARPDVTRPALEPELFRREHGDSCPGMVEIDGFYGDHSRTWAVVLAGKKVRLITARQLDAKWELRILETAAAQPNVALKISGLGQADKSWPHERNRHVVRDAIAIFGVARCMFASNFPVDGLCIGYRALFDAFKAFVADRPADQQRALFHDNAVRTYRMTGI